MEVNSAIFFPLIGSLNQPWRNALSQPMWNFPITGYDVDGDPGHGPSDRTSHATVTISGGFMADEDRLYIRNATEDGNFSSATNSVGDIVHTYSNISKAVVETFPAGVTLTSATYNAAQGFMLLSASASIDVDIWEQVFDEIIYVNIDNADMDPTTIYTPIDKQIVFSLGRYPARKVDGDYHFYHFEDCAAANCKTWVQAFDEAKSTAKRHLGLNGYLATITSDEENTFVSDRARSQNGANVTWAAGWLGATGFIKHQIR